MIRVGLGRSTGGYGSVLPPFAPDADPPEIVSEFGAANGSPRASNPAYTAVRRALRALGLDGARFGSPAWNPLAELVPRGGHVVLKPNFIRHWNPCPDGTLASVITHGAIVRVAADYAFLAVGRAGSVTIAEAPQQDCDFDEIRRLTGLDALVEHYRQLGGRELRVVDLRREAVEFRDGVIVKRRALPGDPLGYRVVDLGERSFFARAGLDPQRFRGADYDPGPTMAHHLDGHHAYLLSETVLRADLVINLPKIKTHKKTGVTLAVKNLVGINGDKNWLPHHSVGSPGEGGDEFPESRLVDRLRSRAIEWARPVLSRGRFTSFFRAARRVEGAARGTDFIRSGNWHGNQTTWRMCLDLNRAFYYSDAKGLQLDARRPVRRALTILDGIVAGEGNGPLAPSDVPLGVVLAATDPIAADIAATILMGFSPMRIPKIREAMADGGPRITELQSPAEVSVFEGSADESAVQSVSLAALRPAKSFLPHAGWQGAIEGSAS